MGGVSKYGGEKRRERERKRVVGDKFRDGGNNRVRLG